MFQAQAQQIFQIKCDIVRGKEETKSSQTTANA
jgi:hypothetical protein